MEPISTQPERDEPEVSKNVVLVIAALSSFLTPFTASSVNIALPSIKQGTGHGEAVTLSWVATAYLLAAAMFLVPFGRIADIKGRKRIFLYGISIDAAASLLCSAATSGPWLITFRALQGLGGAMIFGTGVAILTSVFPPRERGRALGINVAAGLHGLVLRPPDRRVPDGTPGLAQRILSQLLPGPDRGADRDPEAQRRMGRGQGRKVRSDRRGRLQHIPGGHHDRVFQFAPILGLRSAS